MKLNITRWLYIMHIKTHEYPVSYTYVYVNCTSHNRNKENTGKFQHKLASSVPYLQKCGYLSGTQNTFRDHSVSDEDIVASNVWR